MYLLSKPHDDTDERLVERCRTGDLDAFETLVCRYEVLLFKVALRMLGNRAEAEDATQNTFLKLYENLASYDPSRRFFSWAYRILMNDCLNAIRGRRPAEPLAADVLTVDAPLNTLEAQERRRTIQRALLALPVEQREVVVLRHYGDMSYDEIGTTLDIPAKTVKSRLHAARMRLLELLIGCRV